MHFLGFLCYFSFEKIEPTTLIKNIETIILTTDLYEKCHHLKIK